MQYPLFMLIAVVFNILLLSFVNVRRIRMLKELKRDFNIPIKFKPIDYISLTWIALNILLLIYLLAFGSLTAEPSIFGGLKWERDNK